MQEQTDKLFDNHLKINWTQDKALVRLVFHSQWYAALTVERINRIAGALADLPGDADLQRALTQLVKAKVLRSYSNWRGERLYEVNY